MDQLLPDQVKALWQQQEQRNLTSEECYAEQERLIDRYRVLWREALHMEPHASLEESILAELAAYMDCEDLAEVQARCEQAVATLKQEWEGTVVEGDRASVEEFYDTSHAAIYELMWWHAITEDLSPLAYVTALEFARLRECRDYLDFGAGVGSGGILFTRHGFAATLADISSPLQQFSQWRLKRRGLSARCIDLKVNPLPRAAFDLITAMDVFEHLVDPIDVVDRLSDALKPGGFLFARLASEVDEDRPQHIVQDFGPTFRHLDTLGFTQVWQDEWLWGHVVFQKP